MRSSWRPFKSGCRPFWLAWGTKYTEGDKAVDPASTFEWSPIGWSEVGNLSPITNDKAGKEAIRQALQSHSAHMIPTIIGKATQQLFAFRRTTADGDLVLASDGEMVIGLGRVKGEYSYDPSSDFPHHRPVEWLSLEEWHQPDPEGKLTTVYRMRKDVNLLETERRILSPPPTIVIPQSPVFPRIAQRGCS
jgi:5-methylcytosine-specific restriction protein B